MARKGRHGGADSAIAVATEEANRLLSPAAPDALIDLDTADEGAIERLPRIGPALARRIVGNRDSLGPFGTLSALRRVKGLGPATRQRLAPLVTFSAPARR
jgi:competence protein ComEA